VDENSVAFLISLAVLASPRLFRSQTPEAQAGPPTADARVDAVAVHYQRGAGMSGAWVGTVQYRHGRPEKTRSGTNSRNFVTKGRAERWLLAYPAGSALTVRVNPRQPADSVIADHAR
jgi:hypothetical protein